MPRPSKRLSSNSAFDNQSAETFPRSQLNSLFIAGSLRFREFARRTDSLGDAISKAIADLAAAGRPEPACHVMPSAAYTVPFPKLEATEQLAAGF